MAVRERMGSGSRWVLRFVAWAAGEIAMSFTDKGYPGLKVICWDPLSGKPNRGVGNWDEEGRGPRQGVLPHKVPWRVLELGPAGTSGSQGR